jgi:hypothetical protein
MRLGWWWARRQLYARPVAHLGLVVLIAVAGGLSLGAATGARRTQTSLTRLEEAAKIEDASIAPSIDPAAARQLPNVVDATVISYVFISFPSLGPAAVKLVPFASSDDHGYRTIDRGVLLAGRRPDQRRVDEVAISPGAASRLHLAPGTTISGQLATFDDMQKAMSGGEPQTNGPTVQLRVVGVVRQTTDVGVAPEDQDVEYLGGSMSVYLTSAFFNERLVPLLGEDFVHQGATIVRLKHGDADIERLRADVTARFPELADPSVPGVQPASQERSSGHRAVRVETAAMIAFAVVLGLASLVLIGQALVRQQSAEASATATLRALGLSSRQLLLGSVMKTAIVASAGAMGAVALAIALSPLTPIGLARRAEPHPGLSVNTAMLAIGVAFIVVLLVVWAAPAAARSARATTAAATDPSPSQLRRGLPALAPSAAALTGVRMAVDRGRSARQLPVRSAVVTVAIAIGVVAAATTFGASLVHLVRTPADYSWNWDVALGNPNNGPGSATDPDAVAASLSDAVRDDPHIAGYTGIAFVDGAIGREHVRVMGADTTHGTVLPTLVSGRYPATAGEIVTTRGLQRSKHLRTGQAVVVRVGDNELRATVVGTIARPTDVLSQTQGEIVATTMSGLQAAAPEVRSNLLFVRYARGIDAAAEGRALRTRLGPVVLGAIRSSDVENLARVSWMPNALAALLGVLAVATFGHALLVAGRRRRPEIAVLKTLGFRRRQVAIALAWYASLLAAVALVVGLPVGTAAGRIAWLIMADAAEVVPVARTPLLADVTVVVAALLAANLLAAGPGWAASRLRPTEVLRTD